MHSAWALLPLPGGQSTDVTLQVCMVRLEFLPQHLAPPGSLVRVGTGGQDAWVD